MKTSNPIIDEIHAYRAEHARQFDYDLKAICAAARQRQRNSGHEIVSFFAPARLADSTESVTRPLGERFANR
jgi:hypothetical protein